MDFDFAPPSQEADGQGVGGLSGAPKKWEPVDEVAEAHRPKGTQTPSERPAEVDSAPSDGQPEEQDSPSDQLVDATTKQILVDERAERLLGTGANAFGFDFAPPRAEADGRGSGTLVGAPTKYNPVDERADADAASSTPGRSRSVPSSKLDSVKLNDRSRSARRPLELPKSQFQPVASAGLAENPALLDNPALRDFPGVSSPGANTRELGPSLAERAARR
jgi:hypothetical protein